MPFPDLGMPSRPFPVFSVSSDVVPAVKDSLRCRVGIAATVPEAAARVEGLGGRLDGMTV